MSCGSRGKFGKWRKTAVTQGNNSEKWPTHSVFTMNVPSKSTCKIRHHYIFNYWTVCTNLVSVSSGWNNWREQPAIGWVALPKLGTYTGNGQNLPVISPNRQKLQSIHGWLVSRTPLPHIPAFTQESQCQRNQRSSSCKKISRISFSSIRV